MLILYKLQDCTDTYFLPRAIMPYSTPHSMIIPEPKIVDNCGHMMMAGREILKQTRNKFKHITQLLLSAICWCLLIRITKINAPTGI